MDIRPRHIILTLVVFLVLTVSLRPELISMFFILVFVGIVPGTQLTIPSWVTMLGFVIALAFGIRWLFDQPVYHPVTTSKEKSLRAAARKRVLKHTAIRSAPRRHYKKQTAKIY